MDKEYIRRQIQTLKQQLNSALNERKQMEEQWDALLDFTAKCEERADAFAESIRRRKRKLSGLDALFSRMKAAAAYSQKMTDMLTGESYQKTKRSIDELMDELSSKKNRLRRDLEDIEREIRRLRNRIDDLEDQYDQCLREEKENDGKD